MGATVTTDKAVMAVRINQQVTYFLFEETYEKNCYPHTPSWNCFAIGDYKEVMKKVFLRASSAEGGSLQNRPNNLKPETYLRSWAKAFMAPLAMPNLAITLKVLDRHGWRNGIESSDAGVLKSKLEAIGRSDLWQDLGINNQDYHFDLFDDLGLVKEIFGVNGIDQPWKVINLNPENFTIKDVSLAPAKCNSNGMPAEMPRVIRFKTRYEDKFAKIRPDGSFEGVTSEWQAIQDYVKNQAYECEMVYAGLGVKNIQSYREMLAGLTESSNDFDAYIQKTAVSKIWLNNYLEIVSTDYAAAPETYKLESVNYALENCYFLDKAIVFVRKSSSGSPVDQLRLVA